MSFPFIVAETTGPKRSIVLRGRSLPYREVNWGGEQRVNISYFPGNPKASSQVIGQTYKPTTIRGTWKDTFLFDGANAPRIVNFPDIGTPGLPPAPGVAATTGQTFVSAGGVPGSSQSANRARTVRDAFELIRRSGQLLRVEWGSLVRFGFLTSADYVHDREEDIRWELEFSWVGDTAANPTVRLAPKLEPLGLFKSLTRDLRDFVDAVAAATAEAQAVVTGAQQQIQQLASLVTELLEALQQFASLALIPQELLGTIQQQLTAVGQAARALLAQIRATPPAYAALVSGGDAVSANLATGVAAALAAAAKKLGASAISQRRELAKLEEDALLGLYVSPGGVTLRDVATRFYGSPANWAAIKEFNGFSGSVVPRGVVVRVPRV